MNVKTTVDCKSYSDYIYNFCRYIRNFVTKLFTKRMSFKTVTMEHGFSPDQVEKLGNTIRFLTMDQSLTKTKVLKLLYFLEEESIRKYGIPFFNIPFEAWQFGPVSRPVYTSFDDIFNEFARTSSATTQKGDIVLVNGIGEFSDDEFSDNDIDLMEEIMQNYSDLPSDVLVEITHRKGSPWYNTANENGLLDAFLEKSKTSSDVVINFDSVIDYPILKERYSDYLEIHGSPANK